jgi:hypothetical protein
MTTIRSLVVRLSPLVAALVAFASGWTVVLRHPLCRPVLALVALVIAAQFHPESFLAAPLLMGVLTETAHTGGFMVAQAPGTISRDTVTVRVPASTTLQPGTVLGKVSASGKYVQFDDTLSDGGESAAGILYGAAVNDAETAADVEAAIVNYCAEVREADLIWADGADSDAGLADLRALGIKARPAQ